MAREEIAFLEVRIAGEDEGADAHRDVALELGEDLIRIADDRARTAAPRPADPAPDVFLDVVVLRLRAEFVLPLHARRLVILCARPDLRALRRIEPGKQPSRRISRRTFRLANNDVDTQAIVERAPERRAFALEPTAGRKVSGR